MAAEMSHIETGPGQTRLEQLDYLSQLLVDGAPILVHGSIGHAAMMGAELPSEVKFNGTTRDIDVYNPLRDKWELEDELLDLGVGRPQPIDAGMSSMLVREGDSVYASLDGITTELKDAGVFEEVVQYEVPGSDGVVVNSFSPLGMLAAHCIKPDTLRFGHIRADRELARWFESQNLEVPDALKQSIAAFHAEYKAKYPKKVFLESAAQVYVHLLPEAVRSRLRRHTHRFMRTHAGRETPFLD